MTDLILKKFNIHSANQFIESFSEKEKDNYYMCFGKHTEYTGSDSIVESPVDTLRYVKFDLYNDLIFGKKISSNDVVNVVRKISWTSNTQYDYYDDQDDMSDKDFYVYAQDGSNFNIFKCLNNANTVSTVMPSTISEDIFTESDGYCWKYMYTITSSQWSKFSTSSYMPVYSNTDIQTSAIDRSIEVILNEYSGSYYNNYTSGTFETGTQLVSTTNFNLSGNAESLNDYYTGCVIEFTTSSGTEYREITDYAVSGSTKAITISLPVENTVEVGDTYRIYPKVSIYGDGKQSINCLAWAIINSSSSNSVSEVEVLNSGVGYRDVTANVTFSEIVGVTDEATLRPIVSPVDGHGYDPTTELFGNRVCVSVRVSNTESNNIVSANDYRNLFILKNPEFNNVTLEYVSGSSIFDIGETVYQYRPIQLVGTAAVNASSNGQIVTGTGTQFEDSLIVGENILLQNSTASFVSSIETVSNSTQIILSSAVSSNMASSNVFLINVESTGVVTTYTSNSVTVSEVVKPFITESYIIGSNSQSYFTSSNVVNNGRSTNLFNTFQQTVKFLGTKTTVEDFTNDEIVFQSGTYADESLRPTGRIFHYVDDTTDLLYLTNENNSFSSNAILVGNSSGASFTSTNKYDGDLIRDSGEILYISNIAAVSRNEETTDVVKIILEF